MSEDVAQDQNPNFVRMNSMFNVFEVAFFSYRVDQIYTTINISYKKKSDLLRIFH